MSWRQILFPVLAAAAAWAVWQYAPALLDRIGLGEFLFVGRFGLIVLALTAYEKIVSRI